MCVRNLQHVNSKYTRPAHTCEDTCTDRGRAITITTKSDMYHFTFWSLKWLKHVFFPSLFFSSEQRGSHLIILCPSAIEACRKWVFVIVPPWPGNYPNLPSSCAPAPAPHWLRPPQWLHYQCWDSLMAWRASLCRLLVMEKPGGEEGRGKRTQEDEEEGGGVKKWDTEGQEAALKVNVSIMKDKAF